MKEQKMRVVVLGAGGFVGGWISEELSLRADIEQVACVRKWASAVRVARRGIPVRQADLEDTTTLSAIVSGADAVINATMPAPHREPGLVAALYAACRVARVRRFVQLSSAAVYGPTTGLVDENSDTSPDGPYARGKVEMERRLAEAAKDSDVQVVVLRPSIIYGPFSDGWTVRFVQRIVEGRWRTIGTAGEGTCNLIYAQDLARLVITAAIGDLPPGMHILNVNGPDRVTWNQYIEALGDALDVRDRITPGAATFRIMLGAARVLRKGSMISGVRTFYRSSTGPAKAAMTKAKGITALYPTPMESSLLTRKVYYVADRAAQVLGAVPAVPLAEGLARSAAWCRIHGLVPESAQQPAG